MNNVESYILLFTDSLIGNLAISPSAEFIIYSMKMLGGYDYAIIMLVATCASILSISLNYLFGKILVNILSFSKDQKDQLKNNKFIKIFTKYHLIFLLFSIAPFFGKFIQVLGGFCGLKWLRVLMICASLKFCYYIYLLLF